MTADAPAQPTNCPYCASPIRAGERVHRCALCGTLHHEDCWHENGDRCCVYSCRGRSQPAPVQPQVVPGVVQVGANVADLADLSGHDAEMGPRAISCGLALMLFLLLCIVSALRGPAYEEVSPRRGVSTPSAETREVGVRMVSLQIGDERGEESHEVLHDTQEFHTASGAIYVTAFVNGPMGGPVKGTLTAIDGKLGTRKVVSEQLGGVAEGFPAADKKVWFKFARPASGWQAGKYEVRVGTEKLALGKVDVTVR